MRNEHFQGLFTGLGQKRDSVPPLQSFPLGQGETHFQFLWASGSPGATDGFFDILRSAWDMMTQ